MVNKKLTPGLGRGVPRCEGSCQIRSARRSPDSRTNPRLHLVSILGFDRSAFECRLERCPGPPWRGAKPERRTRRRENRTNPGVRGVSDGYGSQDRGGLWMAAGPYPARRIPTIPCSRSWPAMVNERLRSGSVQSRSPLRHGDRTSEREVQNARRKPNEPEPLFNFRWLAV
jgi:hypothetical protein